MENTPDQIEIMRSRFRIAIVSILFLIGSAIIIFKHIEHWSWIDAYYFVISMSATVGFGDIAPVTPVGRLIAGTYILIMVPIILYSFTTLASIYFDRRVHKRVEKTRVN